MPLEPGKIRNVAVVAGTAGRARRRFVERCYSSPGRRTRLGTVEAGTTVSDWDDDEQRRRMSLRRRSVTLGGRAARSTSSTRPATDQADTIAGLNVVEGAPRRRLRRDDRASR
jgi:hypothetical protein